MIYLNLGLALVALVLVVCLILNVRHNRKQRKRLNEQLKQSQEKIDALYRENLFLKYQGKEYTVASNYEVKLLGAPPILDFVRKQYRPVIRFSGSLEHWKLTLVGAEIYVEDHIGDEDARLVVERCVNRISAEEFDDLLYQFRLGFID